MKKLVNAMEEMKSIDKPVISLQELARMATMVGIPPRLPKIPIKKKHTYNDNLLPRIKHLTRLTKNHEPLVYQELHATEDGEQESEIVLKPCDCDNCKLLKQLKDEYATRKANRFGEIYGTAR